MKLNTVKYLQNAATWPETHQAYADYHASPEGLDRMPTFHKKSYSSPNHIKPCQVDLSPIESDKQIMDL